MKVNPRIFKSYDLRGKYPEEINEELAYQLGRAVVAFFRQRLKKEQIEIIVGRDNRLSSDALYQNLARGILEQGANLISLGVCTTPLFYFAVGRLELDEAGLMITASHLPKEYNGFKIAAGDAIPIDSQTGLKELKKIIQSQPSKKIVKNKGRVIEKNFTQEYLEFNLANFKPARWLPLKIIIDTGNGAAGPLFRELAQKTRFKTRFKSSFLPLFFELNGSLPQRSPDCLDPQAIRILAEEVLNKEAFLGVSFDGDGDRMVLVDEEGRLVPPDLILALLSESLLEENPGAKIIYTVRASRIVSETIKKNGGIPILWRVGHSRIKRKMKQEGILFGGEISGHYYHRDHYFSEAPFFVLFKILELISREGKKLSELVKPFRRYFSSGEINFKIKTRLAGEKILQPLARKYRRGKIFHLDGLSVEFPNWWFNLRASQTEPVLRLIIEAKSKKLLEEKKKEIEEIVKEGDKK